MICIKCNNTVTSKSAKKFCSRSCSVSFNNEKRKALPTFCEECGKGLIGYRQTKFCSKVCETKYKANKYMSTNMALLSEGKLNDLVSRRFFRRISKNECSICHNTEWNNEPIPLVVDHVDGNHTNNKIENLRMICCNCDAQLPTYKARNKGHGRTNRK